MPCLVSCRFSNVNCNAQWKQASQIKHLPCLMQVLKIMSSLCLMMSVVASFCQRIITVERVSDITLEDFHQGGMALQLLLRALLDQEQFFTSEPGGPQHTSNLTHTCLSENKWPSQAKGQWQSHSVQVINTHMLNTNPDKCLHQASQHSIFSVWTQTGHLTHAPQQTGDGVLLGLAKNVHKSSDRMRKTQNQSLDYNRSRWRSSTFEHMSKTNVAS